MFTTCISRILHISDLRSGQSRDFPIVSQWGKNINPSYSVETKQTRTILSIYNLISPLLINKLQILTSDPYLGQLEVIQGHENVYVNNSLNTYRISLKLAPKCLSCQDTSGDMQLDLYR